MVRPSGLTASSLFFTFLRKTWVTLAVHRSRLSSVMICRIREHLLELDARRKGRLKQVVKDDVFDLNVGLDSMDTTDLEPTG
jgi:hypothetical protein